MNLFENTVKNMVRYMYYFAGLAIVIMMLLTSIDVFLRFCVTLYVTFKWDFMASWRPIPGTYEIVALLGSAAAAFAMAHTSVEGGHVAVSFVVRLFSTKVQACFKIGTDLVGGLFFAMLAWRSTVYALQLQEMGEVTMTLEMPYYPFVYGLSISSFAVCLVLLMTVIQDTVGVSSQ